MLTKDQKLVVVGLSRRLGSVIKVLDGLIAEVKAGLGAEGADALRLQLNRFELEATRRRLLGQQPEECTLPVFAYGAPGVQQMVDDDKEQNPFDDDGRHR
jgi:hypothetical protein